MRISGLASGMDIDTLVQQMMKAKRVPLDKLNQQKQVLEWKRDNYRAINSQLVDFRNNKLFNYKKSESMNAFKSEVTGDTDAISAKATTNANRVTMEIKDVKMATQFSYQGDSISSDATKKTTLGSLQPSGPDNYTLTVSRGANDRKITFEFSKTDTIDSIIRKINGDGKANVTASFDEATGKFAITSNEYGSKNLVIEGPDFMSALKLPSTGTGGEKATANINGVDKVFDTNKNIINGVEITFLADTKAGEVTKITTKTDSAKIMDTIQSFIKDYNSVLEAMNKKLDEERYRDFPPLSEEQKKEMKENDVKLWTEKAQSGLLKNDEILRSAVNSMRQAIVTASVDGSSMKLSTIGITTGEWYEGGKLSIADPEKLQKAIEEHPDEVIELFIGSGDPNKPKGYFNEVYDNLENPLRAISERAGTSKYSSDINAKYNEQSVMGKELTDLKSRISDLTRRLTDMETRYYTQFSAMENALNKMNSQSASLASFGMN